MGIDFIPPHFPILSLVIFLPILGALALLVIPRENKGVLKNFAIGVSVVTFLASLWILKKFDSSLGGLQAHLADQTSWLPMFNVQYFVAIDGISLWLVMLTTFLGPIIFLSSYNSIKKRLKEFLIAMLVLQTGILGAFCAMDMFLFYMFWELMLIPMYLLIGIWGGKERIYATVKFFIYTMSGSVLMLVGIIYLYIKTGSKSFLLPELIVRAGDLSFAEQMWLFASFGIAFAIKVPIFPFHTWLPDAHTEAPTAGSVILAGVMLKLGTYGFVRFGLPLFPEAIRTLAPLVMILSVWGIIYGAWISYVQKDVKRLVAYSSVSHLGFVMVGIAALTEESITGAVLQMVNHGICTGGLFIAIGYLYEQRKSRLIADFGGLAKQLPRFAVFFMILTLGSIGLPGTNGFIGEFLIIAGTFQSGFTPKAIIKVGAWHDGQLAWSAGMFGIGGLKVMWFKIISIAVAILATFGVLMGAVYMLSMYRRVMFGPLRSRRNRELKDLDLRNIVVAVPLVLLIFWIGIYPSYFIDKMEKSVSVLAQYIRPELRNEPINTSAADQRELKRKLCVNLKQPCPTKCNPVDPTPDCIKPNYKGKFPRFTLRELYVEKLGSKLKVPVQLELPAVYDNWKKLKRKQLAKKGGK